MNVASELKETLKQLVETVEIMNKSLPEEQSAEKEFGLTFDEIVVGIRAGKLQYRENSIYGGSLPQVDS